MEKQNFIDLLKTFRKDASSLAVKCQNAPGRQVQSKTLLSALEALATTWFEEIEPILRSTYSVSQEALLRYHDLLGGLLVLAAGRPSKSAVHDVLGPIAASFHVDILVPVQKSQAALSRHPSLDAVISHAQGLEVDYLTEAVDCAQLGRRRAAIILGWCAVVNRLHVYVEREGFAKFNQASAQMSAIQLGRYKRFNNKYEIQNLSDLRMTVFDGNLLWVLEFIGAIDGNQHERLGICFTMRNTCAHPGDATFSEENVRSFFSDIDSLVFTNPKFAL
jgi:hypothetical protein